METVRGETGALPDVLTGGKVPAGIPAADELQGLAAKVATGAASDDEKARFRVLLG